jgi:hypothetical protein
MKRRKFLIAAGSVAAGSAAILGTGATDSVQANRDVQLDVAGDSDAILKVDAKESNFVDVDDATGVVSFDFSGDGSDHSGVNNDAVTAARPALTLKNQGDQTLYTEIWNPFRNGDIDSQQKNTRGTSQVTMPAGLDFQFIAVPTGKANGFRGSGPAEAALIDRDDGPETPDNFNPSAGSFGDVPSNVYIIGDPSKQNNFAGAAAQLSKDGRQGHIPLDPGESVDVIARLVADGVDLSSTQIPTGGPVYLEAFSDSAQTTFDQVDGSNTDLGIGL